MKTPTAYTFEKQYRTRQQSYQKYKGWKIKYFMAFCLNVIPTGKIWIFVICIYKAYRIYRKYFLKPVLRLSKLKVCIISSQSLRMHLPKSRLGKSAVASFWYEATGNMSGLDLGRCSIGYL